MKNKLILFVFFLGSLISSTGHIQAQCSTCNVEIKTGSGTLELSPNEVTCITETLTFDAIKWADNATLCIAPGKTLTIRNNMENNEAEYDLTLELYGKLVMQNPEFNPNNLTMNIHSGGSFEAKNTAFKGNNVKINNQGNFHVSGLNLNGNSGTINIFNSESANSESANFIIDGNLNVGSNIELIYNNEGSLKISNQFDLSAISKFSNCGKIEVAAFNLRGGTVYNTGIFISNGIDGEGKIHNYGTIKLKGITGSGKKIYNYGTIDVLTSPNADMEIHGPTEGHYYGEFKWKGEAVGNDILVFGNQLFKNTDGDSSLEEMFQNTSALKEQTGSSIIWGNCSECEVVNEGVECIDAETGQPGQPVEEPVEVCEEEIFFEDFGTSNLNDGNFGRKTWPNMPNNSFKFGTPYPESNNYDEYMIDNDHYAVVAPGYIKAGTDPNKYYFWTPAYNEANTVTDRSGTEEGAVMVINAGSTLLPFYQREYTVESNTTYRASFWLYLVNGPSKVAIDVINKTTGEVLGTAESELMQDWNTTYKGQWTQHTLHFATPEITPDCNLSDVIISIRNANDANFGNDYYIDDIKFSKLVCDFPTEGVKEIKCPEPEYKNNYWHGTVSNEWGNRANWTGNRVPDAGEDVEFATELNNPTIQDDNSSGPAIRDLYLDDEDQPYTPGGSDYSGGRIIGNLINNSEVDLVITAGNQLIINGEVTDDNPNKGTIVVKADPLDEKPSGTLIFKDPTNNLNVGATVEFYNKAYDCADCGFYRRSWQYFGIPVNSAAFPYDDVKGTETINLWTEPYNGDKWRPVTPDTDLEAFKGYQITNNSEGEKPADVYGFAGILNVGDASVKLTRTANVNYPGANLIGNSYTAAIPIHPDLAAMTIPGDFQQTVYLFNTGTRDQWRKLNGSSVPGVAGGQYLAVPVNLGGQDNFPDRIPSMHAFMLLAEETGSNGTLVIDYSKLVKNTTVDRGDGTQIVTRSAGNEGTATSTTTSLPSLVMDVIGEQSADRVWIFAKEGTTHGFDNGWDGRKMAESGIAQLYVTGTDESQLQVATVPTMENVLLGFEADADGKYTLEFSLSEQLNTVEIHLQDLVTGTSQRLSDGGSYQFEAKKGDTAARFRLSQSGEFMVTGDEALIDIEPVGDGKVMIRNRSGNACTVFVSNDKGGLLQRVEVSANEEKVLENMTAGMYVIRLQNAAVNDARRVIVE